MEALTRERFESACGEIIGLERDRGSIGQLAEKSVHAVLKAAYVPDPGMREVPLCGSIADGFTGAEAVEIQTRGFARMKGKLERFLKEYPVVVVYPVIRRRSICWIDPDTGELAERRPYSRAGDRYRIFRELYGIRHLLAYGRLSVREAVLDAEDYRLLNGRGRDRKKGAEKIELIPTGFVEEVRFENEEDYRVWLPALPERFGTAELAAAWKSGDDSARCALHVMEELGIVRSLGKEGRRSIYTLS